MNRKEIRKRKLAIEKNITAWGIRADKLDGTIKAKEEFIEKYIKDGTPELATARVEVARLQLQLIKVNAEYDSFVREHNRLTDVTLANRKTTKHADASGPVQPHSSLQPTRL